VRLPLESNLNLVEKVNLFSIKRPFAYSCYDLENSKAGKFRVEKRALSISTVVPYCVVLLFLYLPSPY